MTIAHAPTHDELVRKASDLAPLLEKHAQWSDENRRLHDDVVDALADAGLFRLRNPARYGGFEASARTLVDVATELGRADGAVGWTASIYTIPAWMAGTFPDHVQDEVFADPDVRICGTLSPSGSATPTAGGVVLNGRWGFVSGALHAQWQEILAMAPTPDGGMQPIMALVPMSDLQIVDDWFTAGLRGSGSVTTLAQDVFVPEERTLPLIEILQQKYKSEANASNPMWHTPLMPVTAAATVGTLLGMAKGAMDAFLGRLPERKITYTEYETAGDAPVTHLQVAEAAIKTDQAEFHSHRIADMLDTKTAGNLPWSVVERARSRADVGAVSGLAKDAVDILSSASGGSSLYESAAIQRINRNVQATNLHALIYPPTAMELYGRVLSGLEPNTLYV
ncbi:acyl-CoA dehydrogenase family protein [Streptomyces sp. V4-01]|uniref:Acyl-CoA dehydrogenase family protein n=1 Tax=Actinacidiphila polyblastidii TaxID=3110430 RepID=A0ABU7PC24_9ACTN|nr:acyl-CoA dehydrogenase family protein [Streptomyces sp. V4-01]